MAAVTEYKCSTCGTYTAREELTARVVMFRELGRSGRTRKSRTESWLCPDCLVRDPMWQRELYDAPGFIEQGEGGHAAARS